MVMLEQAVDANERDKRSQSEINSYFHPTSDHFREPVHGYGIEQR
jgi:hypothetical protein